ncbi:MAG TPA: hypothetical protein VEY12_06240 [Thermoplasmata archaeon]|nr:hypothetical protein [Thermoplasmata archaeon]
MRGPSDLYRVPACLSPSQTEDALRYARLEHAADSLAWTLPAEVEPASRTGGIRQWLTSVLGRTRAAATPAHPTPLRAGVAAVHFGGEASEHAPAHPVETADHPCDVLASAAVILTAQPSRSQADDACTCEH